MPWDWKLPCFRVLLIPFFGHPERVEGINLDFCLATQGFSTAKVTQIGIGLSICSRVETVRVVIRQENNVLGGRGKLMYSANEGWRKMQFGRHCPWLKYNIIASCTTLSEMLYRCSVSTYCSYLTRKRCSDNFPETHDCVSSCATISGHLNEDDKKPRCFSSSQTNEKKQFLLLALKGMKDKKRKSSGRQQHKEEENVPNQRIFIVSSQATSDVCVP